MNSVLHDKNIKKIYIKKAYFLFSGQWAFYDLIISQNNKLIIGLIILHVKIVTKIGIPLE